MPAIEILVDGLDHPEGVCWDPGAEVLWAGGEAGQVHRIHFEERRAEEVARAPYTGSWGADDGRVWRLSPDGEREVFSTTLSAFPNGCAVTADGRYLWIVESRRPTVNRFDLNSGDLEEVTRLDGTVPDGLAFTAEGGVLDLGRWHLSLVESELRGAPLHYPTHWAADA